MKNREHKRLAEVKKFLQLDFRKSTDFQDIVELAAALCNKPVALITLLDNQFNWLKIKHGTDIDVMPRETSFCQFGIQQNDVLIIEDALNDQRFNDNPLVYSDPNLRFYAGAPLILKNGEKIGTLCLFDQQPNTLTDIQKKTLALFAKQVTTLMELELSSLQLHQQMEEIEAKNECLIKIAQLQSHQIRQPLTTLMSLISVIKEGYQEVDKEWLELFGTATENFDTIIHSIVAETMGSKDLRTIRFNKIVDEIEDYAILLLDEKGIIEKWNKGAEKIKGYTSREILGKNFTIFYPPTTIKNQRPKALLALAKKTGVARDEGWRLRKDGSSFWGSTVITAIHNEKNQTIGFTKVTRDLTVLKEAEKAQQLSAEMYNLMTEYSSKVSRIGGWELDLLSNTLTWSKMTKEIHGVEPHYQPELKSGIHFYKKGKSRSLITKVVQQAIEHGTPWSLDLQIITQQGEELWIHTTGKSDFNEGTSTKVYGIFHDISTTKKLL
ncbi:PAS domain S-box protein [Flavobacterium sp. SM2513]|uniref:PAS domain S-box protein n=1 Tax=Flavobacterium sp. SM2513 TaxID=3424766 RepID=UPI003D7FF655